jgi:hypothetical protein
MLRAFFMLPRMCDHAEARVIGGGGRRAELMEVPAIVPKKSADGGVGPPAIFRGTKDRTGPEWLERVTCDGYSAGEESVSNGGRDVVPVRHTRFSSTGGTPVPPELMF